MQKFGIASEQDLPVICSLWQQGFPTDTEEDVLAFWQAMSGEARCLLRLEDETPVSMAFLLPATLIDGEREVALWYVYAAATRKDRRGRGYFGELLDEAARLASENGVAGLFLRPGEPSLFTYYKSHGFSAVFTAADLREVKELYSDDFCWQPIGGDYAALRNERLAQMGVPFVRWSPAVANYAAQMAAQQGGGAFCCEDGLALFTCEDGRLSVQELLCEKEDRERLLASLARQFACQRVQAFSPCETGENGVPFGMLRVCDPRFQPQNGCYLGLTLE